MGIRLVSPFFALAAAVYIAWHVVRFILRPYTSKLRYMRGPKPQSWLLGNLAEINNSSEWVEQYGDTFRFRGILNVRHVVMLSVQW